MNSEKFLVIGATGHVGSKVAVLLADRGHDVTALVRSPGATIRDPYSGTIKYVVGDLRDDASVARAVAGMDVVVSSANGVAPQTRGGTAAAVNDSALRLIDACELAGVKRFVQSSVPPWKHEHRVPELIGKRRIEERLARSTMQSVVVRNPAFMDVWLVMGGFRQAADHSAHATTARAFAFSKSWLSMIGNLVVKHGIFMAPGGANHGTPMISTRDVAELMYAGATRTFTGNQLIEAGGPEWLTWREIADIIARKVGRKRLRIVPIPSWMGRMNQLLVRPFSPAAANNFALISFVADHQPRWENAPIVQQLGVPPQLTVSDYLDGVLQAADAHARRASHPLDNRGIQGAASTAPGLTPASVGAMKENLR